MIRDLKKEIDRGNKVKKELQNKKKSKVFKALKIKTIKGKRERLISEIVSEKHQALLVLSVLDIWRARLAIRLEKHELYQ